MPCALVTGAAKRIGQAVALDLAQQGYDVAIHYHHSLDDARKTLADIEAIGVRGAVFQADLSDLQQVYALWQEVVSWSGGVDVLVNSASLFESGSLRQTDSDLFDRHMAINFKAPLFLMQQLALVSGQGLVINFLDMRIDLHRFDFAAYSLSKKALAQATQMAALEFAPAIRVNGIAPGYILPANEGSFKEELVLKKVPLKCQGSVQQINQAVRYLLENTFVTGQILYVDGGERLFYG